MGDPFGAVGVVGGIIIVGVVTGCEVGGTVGVVVVVGGGSVVGRGAKMNLRQLSLRYTCNKMN